MSRIISRPPARRVGPATEDLLSGFSQVRFTLSGIEAVREILVEDLNAPTYFGKMVQAVNHPTVPPLGSIDPIIATPVRALVPRFAESCNTKAIVSVEYGRDTAAGVVINDPDDPDALPLIQIDATLQTVVANADVNGVPIVIRGYRAPGADGDSADQPAEIETFAPFHSLVATRMERQSPGVFKSPQYTGSINRVGVFGDPPYTWIVTVTGGSTDGGLSYQVTYAFQRNTKTWNPVVVHRDDSGRPSPGWQEPPYTRFGGVRYYAPDAKANGSVVVQNAPDLDWVDGANEGQSYRGLGLPAGFFTPIGVGP